jgi:hypothetical protein
MLNVPIFPLEKLLFFGAAAARVSSMLCILLAQTHKNAIPRGLRFAKHWLCGFLGLARVLMDERKEFLMQDTL